MEDLMSLSRTIKIWAAQVRLPFLLLAVVLVLIGGAAAFAKGMFHGLRFTLAMIGAILAHASVNLFNEYSDYKTGIDSRTRRTPFSGGSGNLQQGLTTPGAVFAAAAATLLFALIIGLYLTWVSSLWLMAFIIPGGIVTVFYTSHIARFMLGEFAAGVCLGTFVVLGTYCAITGTLTRDVILVSISPGILTALLLFLNEFPDTEADQAGGRRHLVIVLGRRRAAMLYTISLTAAYFVLIGGVLASWLPATVLLALLTLPFAIKAASTALRHGDDFEKMVPALGANVSVVLGTDFLIAFGYFIG